MKTNCNTGLRLCGLASLVLLTAAAQAVTVTFGDLVLGVRANSGQGSGVDLEVNIGPAANYYGAAPNSSFLVPGLSALDLTTIYGSTWNTRSDLLWGVAGTTGAAAVGIAPARTLWASRAEPAPGTISSPWPRALAVSLQNSSNTIGAIYTDAPGSLNNGSATANSPSALVIDDTLAGSWTVQDDLTPGVSFRYFNPTVTGSMDQIPNTPAVYNGTTGFAALDLWEVRPGSSGAPGTLLGAFGLNSNGLLVFSTDPSVFGPVPEPSTSLTGLAAALAFLLRRRR